MRSFTLLMLSLLFSSAAVAQPAPRLPRLCFLTFNPGSAESPSKRFAAFFDSLRELGYVHGRTIFIDYLADDGGGQGFPALAAECVRRKSDIIAAATTPAAKAAKEATRTIPIVMVALGDPVQTGLVSNLARPEGNITGISNMGTVLVAKRLALLKEAAPATSRVLVLTYLRDPIAALQVNALKESAPRLGLTLLFHDIGTADDLQPAFEAGAKEGADGLFVTSASIFGVERAKVTELAMRHRLPASYPFLSHVIDAQGLMAYYYDEPPLHRAAAAYVDKILKGARPSDLPVQQPLKFKLALNLKVAKALGLSVPPAVTATADELVE